MFDPLGFVAPVTIAGKAILGEAMTSGLDWDEPLPPDFIQIGMRGGHHCQALKCLIYHVLMEEYR